MFDRTHRDTTGQRPLTIVNCTFALSVFESLRCNKRKALSTNGYSMFDTLEAVCADVP
jgi:hypothetical protein